MIKYQNIYTDDDINFYSNLSISVLSMLLRLSISLTSWAFWLSETIIGPISFMLDRPRWCIIVWLISCTFFCKETMGVKGNSFVPIMLLFLELFNSHSLMFSYGRHDSKNPDVMSRFVDKMGSCIFKGVSQRSLSTIKSDTAKFRRIR